MNITTGSTINAFLIACLAFLSQYNSGKTEDLERKVELLGNSIYEPIYVNDNTYKKWDDWPKNWNKEQK